jgi:DNA-binding XRE family transcriptional regulator
MELRYPLHSSIKYNVYFARPVVFPDGYPINPKAIGERVRKKRMDCGLMQSDVANIVGVSEESIWNWENGRTNPYKKSLEIINAFVTTSLNSQ